MIATQRMFKTSCFAREVQSKIAASRLQNFLPHNEILVSAAMWSIVRYSALNLTNPNKNFKCGQFVGIQNCDEFLAAQTQCGNFMIFNDSEFT